MSAFQTFGADAAIFHGVAGGESVSVRVAGAVADVPLTNVIVFRGGRDGLGRLVPRNSSLGTKGRLEFEVEVQIPTASYPNAAGVLGAGTPTEQADVIKVAVKLGDKILSPKKVSRILGTGGVGGVWHLGLD